jgi:hypothetical protein
LGNVQISFPLASKKVFFFFFPHTHFYRHKQTQKKSFTEENIFQKNIFHIERVWKMERSREVKQRVV